MKTTSGNSDHALDDLDRRLIVLLKEDARAPVTKLASILQVSRATVQARLERLLSDGAILGFSIRTAAEQRGSVRAIMMITAQGLSTTSIIKRLRGFTEIESLHTTNGMWDIVAEIRTADLPSLDAVLRKIRDIGNVLNSQTSILLSTIDTTAN